MNLKNLKESIKNKLKIEYAKLKNPNVLISYSQQLEDIYLFMKYFINKKSGLFIEVGAFNGKKFSNSLFFEKYLNFKSILIEPHPQTFKELTKNRPNSICLNLAVDSDYGISEFYGSGAVAGLKKSMTEFHINKWLNKWEKENNNISTFVPTLPLEKIIKDISVREVDILSIDCEGGELSVLKTLEKSCNINVIVIETGHGFDKEIENELTSRNFYLDRKLFGNQIWINRDFDLKKNSRKLEINKKEIKKFSFCPIWLPAHLRKKLLNLVTEIDFLKDIEIILPFYNLTTNKKGIKK